MIIIYSFHGLIESIGNELKYIHPIHKNSVITLRSMMRMNISNEYISIF